MKKDLTKLRTKRSLVAREAVLNRSEPSPDFVSPHRGKYEDTQALGALGALSGSRGVGQGHEHSPSCSCILARHDDTGTRGLQALASTPASPVASH